jgi:uncharacterized protein YuzE
MRVQFDEKAAAIYLRFDESEVVESEEVHSGIILDFNKRDEVIGIEILQLSISPRLELPASEAKKRHRIFAQSPFNAILIELSLD